MAVVIAFANQKGGVGKTTLSTQFAYFLRLTKHAKVLFVDMDSQGSATETLLHQEALNGTPSHQLFDPDLEEVVIQPTDRGIDLVGALPVPEAYEVEALSLERIQYPKMHLDPIIENYDYVVIDCPPSLGRRLTGALLLTQYVVCPIKLSGYAVSGLTSLYDTINQISNTLNPDLNILGIAVNEFQTSATQRDALEAVEMVLPDMVFKNKIKSRPPIDTASRGEPIAEVRNGAVATKEMHALFKEILKKIANSRKA